jgi:hypothetical protein
MIGIIGMKWMRVAYQLWCQRTAERAGVVLAMEALFRAYSAVEKHVLVS